MKILVINVVYGKGSTGTITKNLCDFYKQKGHNVSVIYGHGKNNSGEGISTYKLTLELESKFCHLLSMISGNLYGGIFFSTRRMIKKINKLKPDVVHLHCLNGFFVNVYKLLIFLKQSKIRTILTNHAEFMFTANCGYSLSCTNWINKECRQCRRIHEFNGKLSVNCTHKYYMKLRRTIDGFDSLVLTCVSPWLSTRFKLSPLYKNRIIETILNPVCLDTSSLQNDIYKDLIIEKKKNRIALFVCNQLDNDEKGFRFFLDVAKAMTKSDYLFVLIGANYTPESEETNIVSLGAIRNELLPSYYHCATATLLFSKQETFSMIVAESLCCGTPVVGFLAGGPESIAIPDSCFFVEQGDVSSVASLLSKNVINFSADQKKCLMSLANEKFNLDVIGAQYLKLCD